MAELDYSQRLRSVDDVLLRELDGEAVILHLGNESYYGLNESGTRMWQVLTSGITLQEALDQLIDEFDVDADTLKTDIGRLVSELLVHKMVEAA